MFGSTNKQAKSTRSAAPVTSSARMEWLREHRQQLLMFGLCASVVLLLWFAVVSMLDRPIQRAEISGKFTQVSPVQIEQTLAPFKRAGFISIDLEAVKKVVLQSNRWIDHVRVERAWPDGLRVMVTEQVAVARWGAINGELTGLLNTRGELFLPDARDLPANLPELHGPEGTETQVARLYLDTYPRLLTVGLNLARVTLDERGAWDLQLTNGVQVRLGRQDVNARLERFISAASPVIATRTGEVIYVDMRYSNGFAIGWGSDKTSKSSGNRSEAIASSEGSGATRRVTSNGNV
ncbi:MAG: cell division protein FtsQ/DivIB [Steroidobacteraceae bacterium]